jgi:hypothetical protein
VEEENMADEIIDTQGQESTEVVDATPSSEAVTYESAAENPEILAAFERTFNKGAAESKEADQGEGEEPTADEPAEEPVAEESEEAAPVAKAPKTAPKPGKEAPAPAPATLDPALLQAARRAKWSDEQIAGLMEANPELAEQTFKTLQGHFNDLSSRYAQFGNLRNTNPQQPAQRQPGPAAAGPDYPDLSARRADPTARRVCREQRHRDCREVHKKQRSPARPSSATSCSTTGNAKHVKLHQKTPINIGDNSVEDHRRPGFTRRPHWIERREALATASPARYIKLCSRPGASTAR